MIALFLAACALVDPGDDSGGFLHACTEIGCTDGTSIGFDPPLSGEGTWLITATEADGSAVTCQLTIPFDTVTGDGCSDPDRLMATASGTMLPVADQEIPDVFLPYVPDAIRISVSRDGVLVAEQDLTLVSETVQPNGPDCPPTCEVASETVSVTP
jgi:hypothetical protein